MTKPQITLNARWLNLRPLPNGNNNRKRPKNKQLSRKLKNQWKFQRWWKKSNSPKKLYQNKLQKEMQHAKKQNKRKRKRLKQRKRKKKKKRMGRRLVLRLECLKLGHP